MRLRNLFMILLLCMTVGMFGVSCTGDDGAQGPPGPKGDTGEPGEVTDADIPEEMNTYAFLKTWGSMTGKIACSDSILTGMGPLPGGMDLELTDIKVAARMDDTGTADVNEMLLNAPIIAQCGAGTEDDPARLGNLPAAIDVGNNEITLTSDVTNVERALVLFKSHRAKVESTEEKDPTNFSRAMRVKTTKEFVGGLVFAKLLNEASQNRQRELLYSNCEEGTAPPDLRGTWRAVKVTTETREYKDGEQVVPADGSDPDSLPDDPPKITTLVKVCVVLDAHPGATKCYVSDKINEKDSVAIYDGTMLHTVVDSDDDHWAPGIAAGFGNLFTDESAEAEADLADSENLCNIVN